MDEMRRRLTETRQAALSVHGALLDATTRAFERRYGRVENSMQLLALVTENPEFAWLNPLTSVIAALDAAIHDPRVEGVERGQLLAHALIDLLRADEHGGPFQARYLLEVQASPEVALAAAKARHELQSSPTWWT